MSDEVRIHPVSERTPERVAEGFERAQRERNRDRPAVSTAERERFFARMAEERKRAEAG